MITQTQVVATTIPSLPNEMWYGWLDQFWVWVEPTTEGALEAIFGVGSVELGLAIGHNAAIHYGRRTFANLYVALIGTTGVPKKTTVVSRGPDLRSDAFPADFIRVSRSIGSGEGLLERFCREEKEELKHIAACAG